MGTVPDFDVTFAYLNLTISNLLLTEWIYDYDYDYDYEITLFEHKQNQHIHIIIVQQRIFCLDMSA